MSDARIHQRAAVIVSVTWRSYTEQDVLVALANEAERAKAPRRFAGGRPARVAWKGDGIAGESAGPSANARAWNGHPVFACEMPQSVMNSLYPSF